MANELLSSLSNACRTHGHIIYNQNLNDGLGGFERAGKRHAIATFFGKASAMELNQRTLSKIKEVLNAERTADSHGVLSGETFEGSYFTDARSLTIENSGGKRVESAAIRKIISNIRNDVAANPAVIEAAKGKVIDDYLGEEANYGFLRHCTRDENAAKDMAETMAKILLNDSLRRNPIESHEQLNLFRHEMPQSIVRAINGFGVYFRHNESDSENFGELFEKFRLFDAENGGQTNCLERLVLTLAKVFRFGDEAARWDEVAASRFLFALDGERGRSLIMDHGFSPDEMMEAFKVSTECIGLNAGAPGGDATADRYVAMLELKLSYGREIESLEPPKGASIAGGDYSRNVLAGLASVFPHVAKEDIGDFISVMVDVLRHNAGTGVSVESVKASAHAVAGAIQFLREQEGAHPGALKDGIQLMKDLHAPVDAETMKGLLDLAARTADGLLHADRFAESLDRNLSALCFAGNGIQSPLERDGKNWIVSKFILASVPKVRYGESMDMSGRNVPEQRMCGDMMLSPSSRNLQAFYARAGGPLCARYAKAMEFLADRYWASGLCSRLNFDVVDAFHVPPALKEKYEMDVRTAVKPGNYKTSPGDYEEFAGIQEHANSAASLIDGVLAKSRIFEGDKVRVKQLALQHVAFVGKASGGALGRDAVVRIASRYCQMAKWGGALLDRLEKEVPASHRKAVMLSLEAYGCSSDARLFDMLTKDRDVLNGVKAYVDECSDRDRLNHAPDGTSVEAYHIHTIITGKVGSQEDLDPRRNPHLATIYSRAVGE